MQLRDAKQSDAPHMAYLINLAGDGIPEYLWAARAIDGRAAMDIGIERAAAQEGSFAHGNTRMADDGGTVLAMCVSYALDDPYDIGDLNEYPEVVRPMIELEARAPGSWYINAIATYAEHRGRGVATTLLAEAEQLARAAGCRTMSLIVAGQNGTARSLYERLGFAIVDSRPVVDFPGNHLAGDWELMLKPLDTV